MRNAFVSIVLSILCTIATIAGAFLVYTHLTDAQKTWLFGSKYGLTLTNIAPSTKVSDYPVIQNANNAAIISGTIAVGTTSVASITTLPNLATANNLTSATSLASLPSLSSIGTIGTGVWHGTVIDVPYGGSNNTTYALYSPLVFNGTRIVATTTSPFYVGSIIATSTLTVSALPNATTTNLSVSQSLFIPSSSSQTPTFAGQLALDTTDDNLKAGCASGTCIYSKYRYLTFPYSTTTPFAGTTSPSQWGSVGPSPFTGTFKDAQCSTDTGTVRFRLTIAGSDLGTLEPNASSTVGTFTYTSANTVNRGDVLIGYFGNSASSPTYATCTLRLTESGT